VPLRICDRFRHAGRRGAQNGIHSPGRNTGSVGSDVKTGSGRSRIVCPSRGSARASLLRGRAAWRAFRGVSHIAIAVTALIAAFVSTDAHGQVIHTPHDHIPDFAAAPTIRTAGPGAWSSAPTWTRARLPGPADIVSIAHAITYETTAGDAAVIGIRTARRQPDAQCARSIGEPVGDTRTHALHASLDGRDPVRAVSGSGPDARDPPRCRHEPHRKISAPLSSSVGARECVEHGVTVRWCRQCRQRQPEVAHRRPREPLRVDQAELVFGGAPLTGAGIAVEDGTETENLFDENFVAYIRGSINPREKWTEHGRRHNPGSAAECFWSNGFNNRFINNVASSCRNPVQQIVSGPGWKFIVPAAPHTASNPRFRGLLVRNAGNARDRRRPPCVWCHLHPARQPRPGVARSFAPDDRDHA
jgi:hypothetical protein